MSQKKILIVEDDQDIRNFWDKILSNAPLSLTMAVDAGEGQAAVENEGPFDLMILDVLLPDEHGYEFLKRLRTKGVSSIRYRPLKIVKGLTDPMVRKYFGEQLERHNAHLKRMPVIITTSLDNKDEILRFKELKVAGLLKKPIDPQTAVSRIVQVLKAAAAREQALRQAQLAAQKANKQKKPNVV